MFQGIASLETFLFDEQGLGDRTPALKGYLEAQSNGEIIVEISEERIGHLERDTPF